MKRFSTALFAMTLAMPLVPAVAATVLKPSFDCAQATKWAEVIVCHDSQLTNLDKQRAELQAQLSAKLPADALPRHIVSQETWIASLESCRDQEQNAVEASPKQCLIPRYQASIDDLNRKMTVLAATAPKITAPQPAAAPAPAQMTQAQPAPAVMQVPAAQPAVRQQAEAVLAAPPMSPMKTVTQTKAVNFVEDRAAPSRPEAYGIATEPAAGDATAPAVPANPVAKVEADQLIKSPEIKPVHGQNNADVSQADIDLEMVASSLAMRLRKADDSGSSASSFRDSQNAFFAFRDAQCKWRSVGTQGNSFFKSCYLELTRLRTQEVKEALQSIPQG